MALVLVMGLVWSCALCGAAAAASPQVYTLHIEAQPLDGALQDFARQTGLQILFFSHLTDGRRAPALHGMYTTDAAMRALLAQSSLTHRQINPRTLEIIAVRRPRPGKIGPLFQELQRFACY